MDKLVFMDLETPNKRQSSICQVGALLVDSQMNILERYSQLIDPHEAFDPENIKVHGITQAQVFGCPSFSEYYLDVLYPLLNDAIFINHNAAFDLRVLNKTICNFDLPFPAVEDVYDTLEMAKYFFPHATNYNLETLCNITSISLNHHDALSDAKAAYELFKLMKRDTHALSRGWRQFMWEEYGHTERAASKTLEQSLPELCGLIIGISLNDTVSDEEANALRCWLHEHERYRNTPIFEDIYDKFDHTFSQGVFTIADCARALRFLIPYMKVQHLSAKSQAENMIKGMIRGIAADKKIDMKEAVGLIENSRSFSDLKLDATYETLLRSVCERLQDGTILSGGQEELIKQCNYIIDPTCANKPNGAPSLMDLKGKVVVLTGDFRKGSRSEITKELEGLGIIVAKGVTKKTNYVIRGSLGSEAYAFGTYGSKVRKAMELGIPVLTEDNIFNAGASRG